MTYKQQFDYCSIEKLENFKYKFGTAWMSNEFLRFLVYQLPLQLFSHPLLNILPKQILTHLVVPDDK